MTTQAKGQNIFSWLHSAVMGDLMVNSGKYLAQHVDFGPTWCQRENKANSFLNEREVSLVPGEELVT